MGNSFRSILRSNCLTAANNIRPHSVRKIVFTTVLNITTVLVTVGMYSQSAAQIRPFSSTEELDNNALAQEQSWEMPKSLPQKKDLFAFSPSADSRSLDFFIDLKNINSGGNVVTYVLVIKSRDGAEQTLLAGINCRSFFKRTFARVENSVWQGSQLSTWSPIGNLGYNNYSAYLGRRALCVGDAPNFSAKDIEQRLRNINLDPIY